MKNGRLFQILYLLLEHQELTASWLAEKLEVSQRTIYRDIDALSAAGIPVYARQGQGGGIRLMEQFQMERQLLDHEEQDLLLSALQSLHSVGAVDEQHMLSRLTALFKRKPVDWLEVDLESWGGRQTEKELFSVCKEAIWNRQLLKIEYDNSEGEHSLRTVEPVRLCFKGGCWYLCAWCRTRCGMRLFRLNRIGSCQVLKDTFPLREYPEGSAGVSGSEHSDGIGAFRPEVMQPFCLKFTSKAAYQVRDFFPPDEIRRQPDGGFLVHTVFPPGRWVTGFLLSFGGEVEVLEPESYRTYLLEEAKQIQKLYET